ncbi:MAG: SEC-C metal-binding domain-containing protein [Colwellia sp.]
MIHRNSPCPCGSSKRYKSCCGTLDHLSRNEPITISEDTIENFNWSNIDLLPEFLEQYLGSEFLDNRVKNMTQQTKRN